MVAVDHPCILEVDNVAHLVDKEALHSPVLAQGTAVVVVSRLAVRGIVFAVEEHHDFVVVAEDIVAVGEHHDFVAVAEDTVAVGEHHDFVAVADDIVVAAIALHTRHGHLHPEAHDHLWEFLDHHGSEAHPLFRCFLVAFPLFPDHLDDIRLLRYPAASPLDFLAPDPFLLSLYFLQTFPLFRRPYL